MRPKIIAANVLTKFRWHGSADYWERRYQAGKTSGAGSYGERATYKAEILNRMVKEHTLQTIIELGCGDGNQLGLAEYPAYLGLDVSATAVERCQKVFQGDHAKSFLYYNDARFSDNGRWLHADATLSLEVIFHLVEDAIFESYMTRLFTMADKQVIIFATDRDDLPRAPQERHRKFTDWVQAHQPDWTLVEQIEPVVHPHAGFFRYERSAS